VKKNNVRYICTLHVAQLLYFRQEWQKFFWQISGDQFHMTGNYV